jgi:hypothetical protein
MDHSCCRTPQLHPLAFLKDATASAPPGLLLAPQRTERMGYNARNDEIRDNVTRMRREWEAQRNALATVRRFNATLSAMFGSGRRLPPPSHQNITGSLSTATVAATWWTWTCALSRVIPKLQSVLRFAMCNARAAMGMGGPASSR